MDRITLPNGITIESNNREFSNESVGIMIPLEALDGTYIKRKTIEKLNDMDSIKEMEDYRNEILTNKRKTIGAVFGFGATGAFTGAILGGLVGLKTNNPTVSKIGVTVGAAGGTIAGSLMGKALDTKAKKFIVDIIDKEIKRRKAFISSNESYVITLPNGITIENNTITPPHGIKKMRGISSLSLVIFKISFLLHQIISFYHQYSFLKIYQISQLLLQHLSS